MNTYNEVFMAVKRHCTQQKLIAEIDCFELIAKETGVPLSKLPSYLNHLQNIGMIKYSMEDRYIHLTTFGMKHDKLVNG